MSNLAIARRESHSSCPEISADKLQLDLAPIIFMLLAILGVFFALTVGGLAGYHWWMAW